MNKTENQNLNQQKKKFNQQSGEWKGGSLQGQMGFPQNGTKQGKIN